MPVPGRAVSGIVAPMRVDEGYVRDVIHAFNKRGSRQGSSPAQGPATAAPTGRPYLVRDNFSPRLRGEVADWCAGNNLELAPSDQHEW
jgi:hypothetical protein